MAFATATACAAASLLCAFPPRARLLKAAALSSGGGMRVRHIATTLLPSPARSQRRRAAVQLPPASAGRRVAAGRVGDGEEQQQDAAAAPADEAAKAKEMPFADLTLRAEADGATARVHRGVLATFSPVFEAALREAPEDAREMVLVGKSKAELDLLVDWLYQEHAFTMVRCSAH